MRISDWSSDVCSSDLVSEGGWGADAIVHLGKHGTVEWLPGKAMALSTGCHPDATVADVPFFYPFVVNDPGEGTQAKRRTHAVVIRSEEHTSELQVTNAHLVCRLLLEKKKSKNK